MSSYTKRFDGRKFDELRPIEAKAGVIKKADGSAYFRIGKTTAYAAVYGPRELYPKFLQDPKQGLLRCNYNMMPFSGAGERVRPGPSRRSKEISLITERALRPVLDLKDFPNAVVDVFVELTETDAGSRCAGICAASIALADAGILMKDLVVAFSVGKVGDQVVVDLDGDEEHFESNSSVDIPIGLIPSTGEITLLQADGRISPEDIRKCIKMAQERAPAVSEILRKALKEKYATE
ncbi:MAG TPA: exosome complex exonuclease Rrp41 [Candidatus Nanoarchaeia archaeon]|nr:exosome complex exonuclease Rrp41 [Candidatus Nanoarchaeia archaeon]